MLLIACPWCGPRSEIEFRFGGQAHLARPARPDTASDATWAEYLFFRDNPRGVGLERWRHAHGCRRWFNLARDTVSHEVRAVYPMGEAAPSLGPSLGPAASLGPGAKLGAGSPS